MQFGFNADVDRHAQRRGFAVPGQDEGDRLRRREVPSSIWDNLANYER